MSVDVETWTNPKTLGAQATGLLVEGQWKPASTGETFPVFDPGTGEVIAEAALGNETDADAAVSAARRSVNEDRWMGLAAQERGAVLWRVADQIRANADELGRLESRNMGIPVSQARGMVMEAAAQYLDAGAVAVGVSGALLGDVLLGGDLAALSARAEQLVSSVSIAGRRAP